MDCSVFMYCSSACAVYNPYVSHKGVVRTLGLYYALACTVMSGYWSYRLFNNLQGA